MRRTLILITSIVLLCAACVSPTALPLSTDTGADPEAWALVPAGEFLEGQFNVETMIDYDFEIMVTEVTNAQYASYLNAALAEGTIKIVDNEVVGYYPGDVFRAYKHEKEIKAGDWLHVPLGEPGLRLAFDGSTFAPSPGYENHPMVMVTWFGAKAYAGFYGWRLPTEIEWEKAARGADGRPYPWGDEIVRSNANFYASRDPFEATLGKQGDTTPVGFYNGRSYDGYQTLDSASPYGLYDMAGNVGEWTGDVYENQHYRYMRGGSKASFAYDTRVWSHDSAGPDYVFPSVGFRCLRDVTE